MKLSKFECWFFKKMAFVWGPYASVILSIVTVSEEGLWD